MNSLQYRRGIKPVGFNVPKDLPEIDVVRFSALADIL